MVIFFFFFFFFFSFKQCKRIKKTMEEVSKHREWELCKYVLRMHDKGDCAGYQFLPCLIQFSACIWSVQTSKLLCASCMCTQVCCDSTPLWYFCTVSVLVVTYSADVNIFVTLIAVTHLSCKFVVKSVFSWKWDVSNFNQALFIGLVVLCLLFTVLALMHVRGLECMSPCFSD